MSGPFENGVADAIEIRNPSDGGCALVVDLDQPCPDQLYTFFHHAPPAAFAVADLELGFRHFPNTILRYELWSVRDRLPRRRLFADDDVLNLAHETERVLERGLLILGKVFAWLSNHRSEAIRIDRDILSCRDGSADTYEQFLPCSKFRAVRGSGFFTAPL